MKQYIRDIIDDLSKERDSGFIPNVPTNPTDGKIVHLDPPKVEPDPQDLDNQELSQNNEERLRQLDYQAQKSEERQRLG